MPLAEIRNYLEQRSPEKFGVLLEQEEKVVREKMQRLREGRSGHSRSKPHDIV